MIFAEKTQKKIQSHDLQGKIQSGSRAKLIIREKNVHVTMRGEGGRMKRALSWITFTTVLICIWLPGSYAAQSTADVSASAELKKKTRTDILSARQVDEAGMDEYIIGIGDVLSVSVYGEGDMAATAPNSTSGEEGASGVAVRSDGRISLKHVGDVHANSMTLTELADYLKVLYLTIYDDPTITTVLLDGKSKKYTIMGKVNSTGIFPLNMQISLVQAVANSGGFTEWANSEITVVRKLIKDKDKKVFKGNTLKFDYDNFLEGKRLEKNIYVQPGDIIIVH